MFPLLLSGDIIYDLMFSLPRKGTFSAWGGDRFEIVKPHADSLHFQEPLIFSFISLYFRFLHQVYLSPELMGQQQLRREIITPLLNRHWKSCPEYKFFTSLFSFTFTHFTLVCCSHCLSCVAHCSLCHHAQ